MNARAFLVRGLLAGVVAGLATFATASVAGEPHIDAAIAIEEATASSEAVPDHDHAEGEDTPGHSHDDGGVEVPRDLQSTWGLLTATLAAGAALGGLVSIAAAGAVGRLGTMTPGQSTATVSLIGFVSVALVPFLKYPSTPPAVGSAGTLGERTGLFFGFLVLSVLAAILATTAALAVRERLGTYGAVVIGAAGYLLVVVVAGQLFAPVDEVGDFPAQTLWSFRVASLVTLATMWGVIGVALTGLVSRLYARTGAAGAGHGVAHSA